MIEKTIKFEGHYVDCWFDGKQWFNDGPYLEWSNPIKMSDVEYSAWEGRLLDSDVWDNLYKDLEAAE